MMAVAMTEVPPHTKYGLEVKHWFCVDVGIGEYGYFCELTNFCMEIIRGPI